MVKIKLSKGARELKRGTDLSTGLDLEAIGYRKIVKKDDGKYYITFKKIETESGKITKKDVDLLNHHISISHSNLEDVFLVASVGASIPWLLASRWTLSFLLVWELRLEMFIRKKLVPSQVVNNNLPKL